MKQDSILLYTNFLGLAYRYEDVHTHVLLVFDSSRNMRMLWHKVVKYWPDDEIRMRFVQSENHYEFVLYGESRVLENRWVFLKDLKTSEYYKRFRNEYDGSAYLGFALYKPDNEDDIYQLEIFKNRKKVTDVLFLMEDEVQKDGMILKSRQLRDSASKR